MASRSVNKVILLGHLGKDAETRFTPSGVARSSFTIATNRRWKDQQSGEWKDVTDWHNVVLWRSENLANYLLKGKQVYVEGRLESRSWEDKDGQKRYITEVVADDLILLGGGRGGEGGGPSGDYEQRPVSMPRSAQPRPQPAASQAPPDDFSQGVTDDDVPF
jgi:single-strand DNA-binding protein